ncbi:PhnD/SsuA/transferrin family substrate-binding protein [Azoarcus taiwanensis]|nr:PhnD/SsuA/transferrin family substrate-binding protein [Azoarcus taiwanensis]
MNRRRFIGATLAAGSMCALPAVAALATANEPLRIGLTPVFLDDQAAFLNRWRTYLSARIGSPVLFVQRASYREISEQISARQIDVAWMCGYPYMMDRARLTLLAVPLHLGRPEYHSYLIVRDDLPEVGRIGDLGGKVFAFSDPNSFSGSLYPRFLLHDAGLSLESHFRRSFFTWSHRKVVEAVAAGLADGGAVAGYVWETMSRLHPEITARTRIVSRSPAYGFPPFVARSDLDADIVRTVREVFVDMRNDAAGAQLLETLNLDGFVPGDPAMFEPIAAMAERVDSR